MAGHAPFLMPDGRSLKDHLRTSEHELRSFPHSRKQSAGPRGKDQQWQQLVQERSRVSSGRSEHEEAEIRMLQTVGVRRRRRWLNDKLLRDMAGPLSAGDMESLFKPAPFGETGWLSPLTLITSKPENAVVWDSFRSIDPEKQNRVLQKWADYNDQQREQSRGSVVKPPSAAAEALRCWARVGRNARQALRRANVSTVLALELQLIEWVEKSASSEERLVIPMDDGFGRLLVHGLADFHGLLSASSSSSTRSAPAASAAATGSHADPPATNITVYRRQSREAAGGASPLRPERAGGTSPGMGGASPEALSGRQPSPQLRQPSPQQARREQDAAAGGGEASSGGGAEQITCTDVLLALAEVGNLNQHVLQRYVRTHIHGVGSGASTPPVRVGQHD